MATSSPRDTQTDSNTSTTGKSREEAGETEKERHTPEGRATALPLPNPALVHGPKAVEVAKSEGKWPIVDLSVDKFAILGSSSKLCNYVCKLCNYVCKLCDYVCKLCDYVCKLCNYVCKLLLSCSYVLI